MKKVVSILLLLAMVLTMTGCQSTENGEGGATAAQVVNVFNWEDYIDPDVITQFEQETGITVNYMCFTTVEDMIVQVEANPGAFDVCFPSDYIVQRMIEKDMLAEINYDNVPYADPRRPYAGPDTETCQTLDSLLNPEYDPENRYSVPYTWGTVCVLYNKTMMPEDFDPDTASWSMLWDTQYMRNIFMMDSIRDSFGITLNYLGYSGNSTHIPELFEARDKLIEQKQLGVVKAYQVDETKDKMVAGEAALAVMWSGDAMYAIDLNEDLDSFVPVEGSNMWTDAAVIPKTSRNKENAEKFINFLCRPDIAAKNWNYIWYSTPNKGAIELIEDPEGEYAYEYSENRTLSPSEEILEKCEFFTDIPEDFLSVYEALWMDLKNTK